MTTKIVSLKMEAALVEKVNQACRALEQEEDYALLRRGGKITFSQGVRILLIESLNRRSGAKGEQGSLGI